MSATRRFRRAVGGRLNRALSRFGYQLTRSGSGQLRDAHLTWLREFPVRTFIDVGANVGEYVDFAARMYPGCAIYAFEPLPECVEMLRQKEAAIPLLQVFNVALGDSTGSATLHRSSYGPASSLLEMSQLTKTAFPEAAGSTDVTVEVRPLDSFFAEAPEPDVFVKIDTQGFEDRVLAGAAELLRRTRIVLIEVSFETLYERQVLFDGIYDELRRHGLEFRGVNNQIYSPRNGAILQAHAYFVRP